ncbi:MAG: sigma-E factor negative regulatory protein [Gammaproteobacteria bacterium]|jgi:anti-sigma factor RsiW|nr:sigma-E factor negative regulatory protein [Gammaproteobacteria bacterium]
MSGILDEQFSAFLDGELRAEELELMLARMDRDPDRRATLGRYAMIGECLRTGTGRLHALPVAESVRSALLAEPAPAADSPHPGGRRRRSGWLATGLAAGLVVVALLASRTAAWMDLGPARNEAPPSVAMADPDDGIRPVNTVLSHRLDPQSAQRLTGYLIAHGEYANQISRNTFDSHLVTARAERAAWRQVREPADVR